MEIQKIYNFYQFMEKNIEYAWLDKDNNKRTDFSDSMYEEYCLQDPKQVSINKFGLCMDQVEFERCWFKKNNIEHFTFEISIELENSNPGHVYLLFSNNNKYYWFGYK